MRAITIGYRTVVSTSVYTYTTVITDSKKGNQHTSQPRRVSKASPLPACNELLQNVHLKQSMIDCELYTDTQIVNR
jgi:hypothetical protein